MASVLDIIAKETNGKSFKTYKYGLDGVAIPRFDYDDNQQKFTWKKYGETEKHNASVPLKEFADRIISQPPLFKYFLDGSRKTYKVDDMAYNNHVFPVIAGQIGVGCCARIDGNMRPLYHKNDPIFERQLIITLPQKAKKSTWDDDERSFEQIRKKINNSPEVKNRGVEFSKILPYSTSVQQEDRIENKGIAVIQNYMVKREQYMVSELVRRGFLMNNQYLLKDGSLEYQVHSITKTQELLRFKNNYRFVVGASKSFNPANCIDKNGRNNSNMIAELPLYSRTPVQMYESERIGNMQFGVWYVRIRDQRYTNNTFDGILKLEKILVTNEQIQEGLDSSEVDMITANIINERNPVCYGVDRRWANHLYPIYVTETFIKSKYIGENMFLKLF